MPRIEGMRWFKKEFGDQVNAAVADAPFGINLITAIAVQESYDDAWSLIYREQPVQQVLTDALATPLTALSATRAHFQRTGMSLSIMDQTGSACFVSLGQRWKTSQPSTKVTKQRSKTPISFVTRSGYFNTTFNSLMPARASFSNRSDRILRVASTSA
jgi:hypothetical protein